MKIFVGIVILLLLLYCIYLKIKGTIKAQKEAEATIEYMAYHDSLTGLYNRDYFYKQLEKDLNKKSINHLAVLSFDLERFKLINESMGYRVGDRLLKTVAERLRNCIGSQGVLARNGGDEFLISLSNKKQDEIGEMAERILTCFSKPIQINDYELYTTPSIGISYFPHDGADSETLIKKADLAMEHAKRKGNNNYIFYFSNEMEQTHEMMEIEMDLRKALDHNELQLHYQPKVNLHTGKITGVEALIRWQHPEKGIISPASFIPLAEETGLIIPIGEWVLRTACAQNKAWQDAGISNMIMSVNLSVRQLYQPNLVEMVDKILRETELNPTFLEIEITENMLLDTDQGLKSLKKLKNLGVQVSLDDFGTEYSSLYYLKEFPIDKLKIDQSFVRQCTDDNNDAIIVKTIIAMAHKMKLKVVAEGVELKEHLVFLQRNLCEEAQGYLFSKPLPPEEFVQKIKEIEQIIEHNGIPQELSSQKWLEDALQMARQELVDTVRQQQGIIFKFIKEDDRFIHTLCDGELLQRMGLLSEQIIGKELYDFYPQSVANDKIQYYHKAWNGEEHVTYEAEVNGIFYIASLRPIKKGGEIVEVIGSGVDITEKKQIEKELALTEANYRLIAENMSDLVTVWDRDGVITYVSPSHKTVLGYPLHMYQEKQCYQWIHPDDRAELRKQISDIITRKLPSHAQIRIKHVNDTWLYFDITITPVLNDHHEVERLITVGRDISDKKKMDELIQKSEKLSVVGQLAAGIAHEIRNPLTSVKGFLQLMKEELPEVNYTDIMLSEINDVEKIVSEFLTLAKPQIKKITEVDIHLLVEHVVTLINTYAVMKNVEIVLEINSDFPLLHCDEHQLKQVFINILQNAVEAMDNGGVITIQVKKMDSGNIKFSFRDQGCGISDERLLKIAEPFFSTKEKGTGLGLMICQRIVEDHGGMINIESVVGQGTTVEIIIPIK